MRIKFAKSNALHLYDWFRREYSGKAKIMKNELTVLCFENVASKLRSSQAFAADGCTFTV